MKPTHPAPTASSGDLRRDCPFCALTYCCDEHHPLCHDCEPADHGLSCSDYDPIAAAEDARADAMMDDWRHGL